MRNVALAGMAALLIGGCASSSIIPMSQDTFQITAAAAPACGVAGAQRVAVQQAAAETIRRGYDRFIIMGGQAGADYVGSTPVVVQRFGYGGAMVSGGQPMVSHSQGLMVRVFRNGDPSGANALSARETLGPDWEEKATKTTFTCLG
jgi:hypothetical protein